MKRKKVLNRTETVLLYQIDKEKLSIVLEVLDDMKIKTRVLIKDDTQKLLGELIGMQGFPAADSGATEGECADVPCMVMSGFSSGRMDQLLAKMRLVGIGKETLKAVVTPYNRGWTFKQLLKELLAEHEKLNANKM